MEKLSGPHPKTGRAKNPSTATRLTIIRSDMLSARAAPKPSRNALAGLIPAIASAVPPKATAPTNTPAPAIRHCREGPHNA